MTSVCRANRQADGVGARLTRDTRAKTTPLERVGRTHLSHHHHQTIFARRPRERCRSQHNYQKPEATVSCANVTVQESAESGIRRNAAKKASPQREKKTKRERLDRRETPRVAESQRGTEEDADGISAAVRSQEQRQGEHDGASASRDNIKG